MKAIITADWHLRVTRPLCRNDENWILTQKKVIDIIVDYANQKNCDLFIVGDIFDNPVASPIVVNLFLGCISKLNNYCYIMAGNHDLPYHNLESVSRSSFGSLVEISKIRNSKIRLIRDYYNCAEYRMDFRVCTTTKEPNIFFTHRLIFPTGSKPNSDSTDAQEFLENISKKGVYFVGDYHKNFTHIDGNGNLLVVPGCITIQSVSESDYKPGILFFNNSFDEIEFIKLPDFSENIKTNKLKEEIKENKEILSFIELLQKNKKMDLSFIKNLEEFMSTKNIKKEVKEYILNLIKGVKNGIKRI